MEQQPPKKTLLTPERTMEIADSLDRESIAKKKFAYQQRLNEEALKLQDKFPIRLHYTK